MIKIMKAIKMIEMKMMDIIEMIEMMKMMQIMKTEDHEALVKFINNASTGLIGMSLRRVKRDRGQL